MYDIDRTTFDRLYEPLVSAGVTSPEPFERIKEDRPVSQDELVRLATRHASAYIRLFAAWLAGEVWQRGVSRPEPFIVAFSTEPNANVRTNIAWTLVRNCPEELRTSDFLAMLRDPCHHVGSIALNYLAREFHRKVKFLPVYRDVTDPLVRLAVLSRLSSFRYDRPQTRSVLMEDLQRERSSVAVAAVLDALTELGDVELLVEYYEGHKDAFLRRTTLALQFAESCRRLGSSRPLSQLVELYAQHSVDVIQIAVIKALATAGGPGCRAALEDIARTEPDDEVREFAQVVLPGVTVTTP